MSDIGINFCHREERSDEAISEIASPPPAVRNDKKRLLREKEFNEFRTRIQLQLRGLCGCFGKFLNIVRRHVFPGHHKRRRVFDMFLQFPGR